MGSVINIGVPTRAFEVQLRLAEGQVVLYETIEKKILVDDAIDDDDEGSIDQKGQVITTNTGYLTMKDLKFEEPDIEVIEQIEIPKGGNKNIYRGFSKGKPADIVLTKDTMEIIFKEKDKKPKERKDPEIGNPKNVFLEKVMEDIIAKFHLNHAYWRPSISGDFISISFSQNMAKSDKIIQQLKAYEIGSKYKSKFSEIPTVLFYDASDIKLGQTVSDQELQIRRETKWEIFVESIKARLTVSQLVESMYGGANLTFDWLLLMFIAGIIAAISTFEMSAVDYIGCMFISQLMGPVLAQTLGIYLRDYKLLRMGCLKEALGLNIIVLVGFIAGFFMAINGPGPKVKAWPNHLILGSGRLGDMISNTIVAILTGVAAAIGLLSGNQGPLNGVAISAAIMLPSLKCGIFVGLALMIFFRESSIGNDIGGCHDYLGNSSQINDNNYAYDQNYIKNYAFQYCENIIVDFTLLAIVSFAITLIHILALLLMALFALWLKELTPNKISPENLLRFWKIDIKIARAHNKEHGGYSKKELLDDINNSENPARLKKELQKDRVFKSVQKRSIYKYKVPDLLDEVNAVNTDSPTKSPKKPKKPRNFRKSAKVAPKA